MECLLNEINILQARVAVNEVFYDANVIVGHLCYDTPEAKEGPFLKIFQEKVAGDRFPITHMCYLNVVNKNVLEVNVRDEQPITLALEENKLIELITLIDGYYRMTGRFTSCLCSNIQPPSIVSMKKRKIHGPVKKIVAQNKLLKNKNRQVSSETHRRDVSRFRENTTESGY